MTTETRDFNGSGDWSGPAIQERYLRHASAIGQTELRDLTPSETSQGAIRWVWPVMERVIEGIKAGDAACIELGIEFIEHGGKQRFGRLLHADTARALRQKAPALSTAQIDRLRKRILGMLVEAWVPHEYHEYFRLLRRIGIGPGWSETMSQVDRNNPYVMRYVHYFDTCAGAR
jgi:hypothetical protein